MKLILSTLMLLGASQLWGQVDFWMKISESDNSFTSHQFHEGAFHDDKLYYCGEFWRDITFGDFSGSIANSEDTQDAFILKTDLDGNEEAFFHFTGMGYERITDIAIKENGEMWICGFFNQGLEYQDTSLIATGFYDAFLARLAPDGTLLDLFQFSGQNASAALNFDALALDNNENVWLIANFGGTIQIGDEIFLGGFTQDGLLIHFSKTGEILETHHFESVGDFEENFLYLNDLAVDIGNNVVVGGTVTGDITLDDEALDLDPNSFGQAILVKFDAGDQLQWTNIYNSPSAAINTLSIREDASIVAGVQFQNSFEFNGEIIEGNGSFAEMAVIGVDKNGGPLWHSSFTKEDFQAIGGIYPISLRNWEDKIYLGGFYSGTIVYEDSTILQSGENQWAYIFELGTEGDLEEVYPFSSAAYCRVNFITAYPQGFSFGGEFASSINFQDQNSTSINSTLFYGRVADQPTSTNQAEPHLEGRIYPNPVVNTLTIELETNHQNAHLELFDLLGRKILTKTLNSRHSSLSLGSIASGIYTYRVFQDGRTFTGKLIKN